jgi:hypothetical protein
MNSEGTPLHFIERITAVLRERARAIVEGRQEREREEKDY